jgi:aspartyl protease family protein
MATGFTIANCSGLAALLLALCAWAAEVSYIGAFGDKAAILSIGGGEPRTVRVGASAGGVRVIAVEKERAVVEVDGKRRVLARGQTWHGGARAGERQSVVLAADARGHFIADGAVNGGAVRFLVDTGATVVALPARDAQRLGIDYLKGQPGLTQTASGPAPAWRVRLDRVRVGGIEISNVEAIVIEQGLEVGLLGMSFLNRVEMRRDGAAMTLTRRF